MCCRDPVTTVFITLPALIGAQHIGRNPACPPPTNEASLLYSECVGRLLVCCQVMCMCVGLHVRTA